MELLAVLVVGRKGGGEVHPRHRDLPFGELLALLEQLVVVVLRDVETLAQQTRGILDIHDVVHRRGQFELCVDVGSKLQQQCVAQGRQRAARAVDSVVQRCHLHLQLVGVNLLGGTHVDGALARLGQPLHVGKARVEQTHRLLHHQDAGVDVLHVSACRLLGLPTCDVAHLHGYVLEYRAHNHGTVYGQRGRHAQVARGVHGDVDGRRTHVHFHLVAAHVLVVVARFHGGQHRRQGLPAVGFGFLHVEGGVLHRRVVLNGIALRLLQAQPQRLTLLRHCRCAEKHACGAQK